MNDNRSPYDFDSDERVERLISLIGFAVISWLVLTALGSVAGGFLFGKWMGWW